jgi:hypothetical protein
VFDLLGKLAEEAEAEEEGWVEERASASRPAGPVSRPALSPPPPPPLELEALAPYVDRLISDVPQWATPICGCERKFRCGRVQCSFCDRLYQGSGR